MHSPRLLLFLVLSAAGHAAVLAPLSEHLVAVLDARDVDGDPVVVSVSVVPAAAEEHERKHEANPSTTPQRSSTAVTAAHRAPPVEHRAPPAERAVTPNPAAAMANASLAAEGRSGDAGAEPDSNQSARVEDSVAAQSSMDARARREVAAEERYLAELLHAISKHQSYPLLARRKGYQGRVEVDLTILRSGEFESIAISKPSDHQALNRASTRALTRLKHFKPFPSDIRRESWQISIPFRYVLNPKQDTS